MKLIYKVVCSCEAELRLDIDVSGWEMTPREVKVYCEEQVREFWPSHVHTECPEGEETASPPTEEMDA